MNECVCPLWSGGDKLYTRHRLTPGSWINSPAVLLPRDEKMMSSNKDCNNWNIFLTQTLCWSTCVTRSYIFIVAQREIQEGEEVKEKAFTYKSNVIFTNINFPQRGREQRCERVVCNCSLSYYEIWVCCTCMHIHTKTGSGETGGEERQKYTDKKKKDVCVWERLKGLTKRLSIPPDDALAPSEVI